MKTRFACWLLCVTAGYPAILAAAVVWDGGAGTTAWSTAANWNPNAEPTAADEVVFPAGLGSAITTTSTENALSLSFEDAYTLSGGTLALASGNQVRVAGGVTASIQNALNITGGLTKTGDGTLVLGGSNINPAGTTIAAGAIRATHTGALGTSGILTTIHTAATLEIGDIALDRPILLKHGGTVIGTGTAASNNVLTIDAAATAVTFGTTAAADVLTIGNSANDLTGGSAATVIGLAGPGTVQLGSASNFDGSWHLTTGTLGLANATALGDTGTSAVTLAGGTLAGRAASSTAINFTGSPGNNLLVTASSSLLSDRTTASTGTTFTFGSLSLGSHTLTVGPGPNASSGTAGIVTGNVTLTGDPQFAIHDLGPASGRLTTGSWVGGGVARSITKTGAGDLAVTGGATDLAAGSRFEATDGGSVEMWFAALGADPTVHVTASQNPFGEASLSVTDGMLRLLANGNNTSTAQTYVVPSAITLGGTVTLDADRQSGSNSNKTYQLPGLTLAAGTDLTIAGGNTHGLVLTGALALQGNTTLRGSSLSSKTGLLTLGGGISGGPASVLTITGGTSPLTLAINGPSSYGGGTSMTGGTVTLNAAGALGTGSLALGGGTLTVNSDGALGTSATLSGGTLRVNDTDALSGTAIQLGGGTLDLRNNTSAAYTTGTLTVSGTSTLNVGNNGSGSTQTISLPALTVAGAANLTLTNVNGFIPDFSSIALAGDLTLSHAITAQAQGISEDAAPRRLLKAGTGTLKLQAESHHSGGTEVLAGILSVEHAAALGSGGLILGDTVGSATATAQFSSGLTVSNSIMARAGGGGTLTLDAPSGGVTWTGPLDLQRSLTLDNGGSTAGFTYNGQISGTGNLTKTGSGTVTLGHSSNTFGGGTSGSVTVQSGVLEVAADGALGNPANGVTFGAASTGFQASGSFASGRLFTLSATGTNTLLVKPGHALTLTGGVAGSAALAKSDSGTLEFAAGADSTGRGAAATTLSGGTLRLGGPNGLSANGPITLNASGAVLQLWNDADTDFGHPVTISNSGSISVDRAAGGSATNGRHRLGVLTMTSGAATVSSANGFGLDVDGIDVKGSTILTNQSTAGLTADVMTSSTGTSTRNFEIGGSGDIAITGAISQASTGAINLIKSGAGTLRFGTAVAGFAGAATVEDGTLDLNGLSYSVSTLAFSGGPATAVPRLVTGTGGRLVLAGNLTSSVPVGSVPAVFTGTLDLTAAGHTFTVNENITQAVDFTIDGTITAAAGATLTKAGGGTLRLTGADNALPGLVTLSGGTLELFKPGGGGIGGDGLAVASGIVRLGFDEQIADTAPVTLGGALDALLELNQHTETLGSLSLAQTNSNDYSGVRTGSAGTLVLRGSLLLANNSNSSGTDARQILITGSGSDSVVANDGTLDLGGAVRTVQVTTTTSSQYAANADATIETRVINGGILKTGPRNLHLTNPGNALAGGLTINEGRVFLGTSGTLGGGGLVLAPAASAGLVLSQLAGVIADPLSVGGTGSATLTYNAEASGVLEWSGPVTLGADLTIEVVNGVTADPGGARLNVTGTIDDGGGTFGLIKTGDGILQLSANNTFDGTTTVRRGVLRAAASSALGIGASPLVLDGGCFHATASMTLAGGVAIAGGGTFRADAPTVLELAGTVDWGTGPVYCSGSGITVLSGATSGAGGDLTVGAPGPFASGWSTLTGFQLGHTLALRGSATLPAGNFHLINNAVLELGNGDFVRPLGTGAGAVQLDTNRSAGWAAHGADRQVNLGGAANAVIWGQVDPPFLYKALGPNHVGDLQLGSPVATHTVDFKNPLDLNNGSTWATRTLLVPDGPALLEARLSGGVTLVPPPDHVVTWLELLVDGALDINGPLSGPVSIDKYGGGTVTLSGNNTGNASYFVQEGTLVIAGNASYGAPDDVDVAEGAVLDASAMTVPITTSSDGTITVNGTLDGSVRTGGSLIGEGTVTGDVTVLAGASFEAGREPGLRIGGDLTLEAGVEISLGFDGSDPFTYRDQIHVTGEVILAGTLSLYSFPDLDPALLTQPLVLIFNDGTDPIHGTFNGLPEGMPITLDGIPLRVTYQANGDGGTVGNDFGLVLDSIAAVDLSLTAAIPLTAPTGATVPLVYTITNPDLIEEAAGAALALTLPAGVALVDSTPVGSLSGDTLTVPLPTIAPDSTMTVTIRVTLPASPAGVELMAALDVPGDPDLGDNSSVDVVAVLAGGTLPPPTIATDPQSGGIILAIDTLQGIRYRLESSEDLTGWEVVEDFTGDGSPRQLFAPQDKAKEFFRFSVIPR